MLQTPLLRLRCYHGHRDMEFNTRALRNGSDSYRYWSPEEESRLVSLAKTHSAAECASILGRTVKSVKQAALTRCISFQKNPRKAFSLTDDNFIRRHVGVLSCQDIANRLGRTKNSVKHRIKRLGLSKMFVPKASVVHGDDDVELCRQLHEAGLKISEISDKMEIPYSTVSCYVRYQARVGYAPEYIYNISELR